MAHGRLRDADQLDPDFAGAVADTMQALATPSRVRILGRLRSGASSVNELAEAVGIPIGCGGPVSDEDFDTDLGRREYRISGLCGDCQRAFFGSA